ncbi:zinc finger protein 800b isoform X2 [Osmerus eperlanus]
MVKPAHSAGRKTSHCLRRQSGVRMEVEMEEPKAQPSPPAPSEAEAEAQTPKTSSRDQSCQTEPPQAQDQGSPHSGSTNPGHSSPGSRVEPGDPPLLQQQLNTSKSGIQQIIECFRSGTAQLRHMLLRDVDTIFECKLCRSLFRGLPNLITHRQYYCLPRLPETDGPPGDSKQSTAIKELLEAIYPRKEPPDHVVRLEPIQTSSKAVFQYLSTEEELAQQGGPGAAPQQHTPRSSRCHSPEPWGGEQGAGHAHPEPEAGHAPRRGGEEDEGEEKGGEKGAQAEEEGSTSGVEDVTISCCLCGQDFNSRRSIRRHCRKMHQNKLEELRKFTETRTVPISLLSMVKGRPRTITTPSGKSCPICFKSFATKANVRRHFDEVHRGLRRDIITPDIATRPGQPLSLEATPPRKSASSSPTRGHTPKTTPQPGKASAKSPPPVQSPAPAPPPQAQYNLASCRCLVCKRKYSSQVMLKRHMRIVHKIYNLRNGPAPAAPAPATPNNAGAHAAASPSNSRVQVKEENTDASDDPDSSPAPSPGPSPSLPLPRVATPTKAAKAREEAEGGASPKPASSRTGGGAAALPPGSKTPKLSVGFDFKQLFCKLCKRQFSSRQNLTKHIELHTDGNDIFIKFYRCPLCRYESRRKRDVLRHVTVVHKKSTAYLAKIMPKLESRAVKRPAEAVLNANPASKRAAATVKEEVNGRHSPPPPPSPPVTRKQDLLSSAAHVTRKQDRQQDAPAPPLTRRSERQEAPATAPPTTRRQEALQESAAGSSEVRVTKNFSLHACDVCGRAFAKKLYLESHKRSHRNAASAVATPENRRKGVSTRSKALL